MRQKPEFVKPIKTPAEVHEGWIESLKNEKRTQI